MQQLSARALNSLDELLERIVPMLVSLEPEGFYGEDSTQDLREAVRAGLVGVLTALSGAESAGDPLDVPRSAGRRQVQQDLPLEGVLRAYRVAGQALWEHFVAQGGKSSAAELLAGASDVWRVIDSFSAAASEGYRMEEALLRRRDDRVQSSLLAALLDGRGADPQFARDAHRALGLTGPWVCVAALAAEPHTVALESPHDRLRDAGLDSVWVSTATGEVGLVGTAAPAKLRRLLSPALRGRAGLSPVLDSLAGLPSAHRLAEVAALSGKGRGVAVLEDDLVGALTVDSPLVADVVWARTIGPLLEKAGEDGPELVATARAFLEAEGSLSDAAAATYVHRNTMLYRLKKIEKITGVSLRELSGQVLWVLALRVDVIRQPAPIG